MNGRHRKYRALSFVLTSRGASGATRPLFGRFPSPTTDHRPRDARGMSSTTVVDLTVYPVKSCAGISVAKAALTETGLRFDRSWMVVEAREARSSNAGRRKRSKKPKPSVFVSQRVDPCLARVEPWLPREVLDPSLWDGIAPPPENACLVLRHAPAPGSADAIDRGTTNESDLGELRVPLDVKKPLKRRLVQVWDWVGEAGDEGEEAARWFSRVVGRPVRLVRWLGEGGQPPFCSAAARGTRVPLGAALVIAAARATAGAGALAAGFLTKKRLDAMTKGGGDFSGDRSGSVSETNATSPSSLSETETPPVSRRPSRSSGASGASGRGRFAAAVRHGARDVAVRLMGATFATRVAGLVESRVVKRFDPRFTGPGSRHAPVRAAERRYAKDARACFSDGFPILVANQTSLDALNEQLRLKGASPVPMNRFRPNVVLGDAVGGGRVDAWAEYTLGRITVTRKNAPPSAPGVGLDLVKQCSRCVMVTVAQENPPSKPSVSNEPLATLNEKRSGSKCGFEREDWRETPFFAWNAVSDPARLGESVAVGDRVDVVRTRTFTEK